jgi:hypothetical protein
MVRKRNTQTMSIILPPELRAKLQQAVAARGGNSLGDEIRKRLEASFGPEPEKPQPGTDPRTVELIDAVRSTATSVEQFIGPWPQDRFAFEVLREALDRILAQRFQPEGEPVPSLNTKTSLADIIFGEGEHLKSTKEMGRMVAALWLSETAKR